MPHLLSPSPNTMANPRMEGEEQDAPFHSYPCALYYVQSPSTASHANSSSGSRHPSSDSTLLSPFPPDARRGREAASRSTLSRYSSSRGSNNSFLHEKKIAYDLQSDDRLLKSGGGRRLRVIGIEEEEEEEGGGGGDGVGRRSWLWRFVSLDPSSSFCCIAFQIVWRFMVSMGFAVLVFFLVTKPPAPMVAFKVVGFQRFSLGEGLDNTGVVTTILTCNSTLEMEIDNNSKLFGLYIRPPTMEMAFGRLKFGTSQGHESYVPSYNSLTLHLFVGSKDKPMYGAGRTMQDMLESGQGVPLVIHVKSRSRYRVVWNLIRSRYHHHGECLVILDGTYDDGRHTQVFNSSCSTTTSHA